MADRRNGANERKPPMLAGARAGIPRTTGATDDSAAPAPIVPPATPATRPRATATAEPAGAASRTGSKFGAAADGWDAYNSWLDRVRQPSPPSRQAVIAKSLYSVSSYKNWADKARGAFDGNKGK